MQLLVSFTVYGDPQPQGSMRAFRPTGYKYPVLTADNKKLKPWRQEVSIVALQTMAWRKPELGPIAVEAAFYFEKPKSTPARVTEKITRPDLDKCLRGLLDGLTGICYKDDSQIVRMIDPRKGFGSPSRVEVKVFTL